MTAKSERGGRDGKERGEGGTIPRMYHIYLAPFTLLSEELFVIACCLRSSFLFICGEVDHGESPGSLCRRHL